MNILVEILSSTNGIKYEVGKRAKSPSTFKAWWGADFKEPKEVRKHTVTSNS